jgi:O-antigen ligase
MRMRIYQRTLGLIAAHPLTGTGPGNYQRVFEAAYPPDISAEGRSGAHAHNLWLHQYAELGLAGGSAYVLLWVWILWLAWRRARAAPNFQSVSLLLALAAMVGSNLTTHMFYQTGLAAGRLHTLLWILVGLVAAPVTASGLRREPGNPDV